MVAGGNWAHLHDVVVAFERRPDTPNALRQVALIPHVFEVVDLLGSEEAFSRTEQVRGGGGVGRVYFRGPGRKASAAGDWFRIVSHPPGSVSMILLTLYFDVLKLDCASTISGVIAVWLLDAFD